ncbi:aminotransferase class V-fold PLP-dependent enzyme [bacterium]|nr:aminotransferase class V-fold PLP-dependent enzyme [bacterium]
MKQLGAALRAEFPIFAHNVRRCEDGHLRPLCYLDSAVSTHKPQSVINALVEFLSHDYGSVHRGAYQLSVRASEKYEAARARVAKFVGAGVAPEQVIFTRGTTESLNILAHGLALSGLKSESRIVIPAIEHHANLVPWQQAALQADCELAYVPLVGTHGIELRLDLAAARKLITTNTSVVSLAHVGNVLGQVNPVQEMTALAKNVGATVILDCAQSMTCFAENPFDWGVDAVVFSGHKLYGPTGIGVLVASRELIDRLPPLLTGGGMISSVSLEESSWASGVAKFEAGTPPIAEAIGLSAALDWLEELGRTRIHAHAAQLASEFASGVSKIPGIELFYPGTGAETIVSFRHNALHAHDLATILDGSNVAMRAGHHCAWPLVKILGVDALVRASFAAYSDRDDVEQALEAIKKAILVLK